MQASDFEVLNRFRIRFLVNKLEKIPPYFRAFPTVSQKRKKELTI